jgi:RNA 2',3'-cyclic 3'-phosphodiesterase
MGEGMENIRTFIAVDIPQEIKMELDKLITELRSYAPDIRWVRAANLHLTLRFLGDIPRNSISDLATELSTSLTGFGEFPIALSGVGAFPNLKRARVIWIGGGEGCERMVELAHTVEKSCINLGFGAADKPFSCHLTIGRVKFPKGHEKLVSKIESMAFDSPLFEVGEIAIFKSELLPAGPRYTRLETIHFEND